MKDFGFLQIWKPMHHLVLISWCSFIDHHLTLVFVLTILSCDAGASVQQKQLEFFFVYGLKIKAKNRMVRFLLVISSSLLLSCTHDQCVFGSVRPSSCVFEALVIFSLSGNLVLLWWLISCDWRLAATGLQLLLLPLSVSFDICITPLYSVLMVVLDS